MRLEVRLAIVAKILGLVALVVAVGWAFMPGHTNAPRGHRDSHRQVAVGSAAREVSRGVAVLPRPANLAAGQLIDPRDLMSLEVHVWDLARRPLSGMEVVAMHGEEVLARGTSGSDGVASLFVPVVPSHVIAHTPDGLEGVDDGYSFDTDEIESHALSVDVTLIDVATLSGRVVDENGEGIEGATLALLDASEFLGMSPTATAHAAFPTAMPVDESRESSRALAISPADAAEVLRTDALGEFAIPIRAQGLWAIAARAEGHASSTSQTVQLTSGASARVELTLVAGHFFAGRVVDLSGAAVPRAEVYLHIGDEFHESVSTGEDGSFRFAGVDTVEASIGIFASGFVYQQSVTAVPDSAQAVYELDRGATLRVEVSAPVAEERMVRAQLECHSERRSFRSGASGDLDERGHATIILGGLHAGATCALELDGRGFAELIENVSLRSAETTVYVDASGGGGVRGRVLWPPAYNAVATDQRPVTVITADASFAANADGSFRINSASIAGAEIYAQWLDDATGVVYVGRAVAGSDEFVTIRLEDTGDHMIRERDEGSRPSPPACAHPICDVGIQYLFGDGVYLVAATDSQHFPINLVAGDVYVDAQGRPVGESDFDLVGPCDTSVRLYLSRPSTRERFSFQIARDVDVGCADGRR